MRSGVAALAGVVVVGLAGSAAAHERSASRSEVRVEPRGAEIEVTLAARDVERLNAEAPAESVAARDGERVDAGVLAAYVAERLVVIGEGGRCAAGEVRSVPRAAGFVGLRWRVECGRPEALESRLFEEVATHHLHFARVREGEAVRERVLAEGARAAELGGSWRRSWSADLWFGGRHVLGGADHLVFLLTLVLASRSLRAVVVTATGFSLGHTLTLVLAALGVLRPEVGLVEAAIGLSVVAGAAGGLRARAGLDPPSAALAPLVLGLVAATLVAGRGGAGALGLAAAGVAAGCALARRGEGSQVALAGAFGLVHGLGFAGALAEARLPAEALVRTLVGFNVGIELAQVAVAGSAWSLLGALERRSAVWHARAVRAALIVATAAGTGWTLARAWAG